MLLFFFFKQKTAYEMRISDWSSDVCSSDLPGQIKLVRLWRAPVQLSDGGPLWVGTTQILHYAEPFGLFGLWVPGPDTGVAQDDVRAAMAGFAMEQAPHPHTGRSEEHTSELQSLMRISYAVFCLKNKKELCSVRDEDHTTETTK